VYMINEAGSVFREILVDISHVDIVLSKITLSVKGTSTRLFFRLESVEALLIFDTAADGAC
jgi:hypothetical protein